MASTQSAADGAESIEAHFDSLRGSISLTTMVRLSVNTLGGMSFLLRYF